MLALVPLLSYLEAYFKIKKVEVDMKLAPSAWQMVPQLFIMIVLEDFFFFSSHMLMHTPAFYKYHKDHHVDRITTSISAFKGHVV